MKQSLRIFFVTISFVLMTACGASEETSESGTTSETNEDDALTPISFILDWTPNTNHTGIYVAKEKGFFAEAGLDVEVMLPGEVSAEQLIASNKGHFGVSFQNELTQARSEGLPIVSIAAVIQHNTSGYASPVEKGITRPKDFEGKVYGAYGSLLEEAMLGAIMKTDDADVDEVTFVTLGQSDFFAATKRDVDFVSIFYAWTGIEAEIRDVELSMLYSVDFAEELDMYAPLIATSEKMITEQPDIVSAFVEAMAKGYEYAIDHPAEAARILLEHEPDLDEELVMRSQEWLSPRYKDEAEQWGIQDLERWQTFANFMYENEVIREMIDVEAAFTNEFLPERE